MSNSIFIEILKILESYEIEGEKCVKHPTPLARELAEKMKAHGIFYTDSLPQLKPLYVREDQCIDELQMAKYRIKKIPRADGGNLYEIEQCRIKKSWWFPHLNQTETWHGLDSKGDICIIDDDRPTAPPLDNFLSLDNAKQYLDDLKKEIESYKKTEIVYETEF